MAFAATLARAAPHASCVRCTPRTVFWLTQLARARDPHGSAYLMQQHAAIAYICYKGATSVRNRVQKSTNNVQCPEAIYNHWGFWGSRPGDAMTLGWKTSCVSVSASRPASMPPMYWWYSANGSCE